MAKNFFKMFFNSNKHKTIISKNTKLNPTYKLSELVTNTKINEDSKILQQQQQTMDSYNILLNYYSHKEGSNNIINNFLEKINKLNKKFYTCSEKFILTKASFDKLSDELYLNLFNQIDCYVEEIQRLNKKITSNNCKDYKIEIKKLKKELSDNKEKIRNYEIKLKEKNFQEEKLLKELKYYKERNIFFKNKININLMNSKARRNLNDNKYNHDNNNINSNISKNNSKNHYNRPRGYTYISKNKKSRKFFSPSPKNYFIKNNKNDSFMSSNKENNFIFHLKNQKNNDNIFLNSSKNKTITNFNKKINDNINNESFINLITVNKMKALLSDEEKENNRSKIKITRNNKPKESIIIHSDKNYNKDDDNIDNISSINLIKNSINNFDDINGDINNNKNKQENEMTPRKTLENRLNKFSPEVPKKFDNFFETLNRSNSIFCDKEEKYIKIKKNENIINTRIKKKGKNISNYFSTLDIKIETKTEKKNDFSSNKNSNKKNMKYHPITGKKICPTKNKISLPSKKFIKSSLKNKSPKYNSITSPNINNKNNNTKEDINIKTTDNIDNNNIEDINNNTIDNIKKTNIDNIINIQKNEMDNPVDIWEKSKIRIIKSKAVRFKENNISDKEQKLYFETSESENNDNNNNVDLSSKDLSVNSFSNKRNKYNSDKLVKIGNKTTSNHSGIISDTLSKDTINNENLSIGDNSIIFRKGKINNKKYFESNKNMKEIKNKKNINKSKFIANKDKSKLEQKTIGKEKELLSKILKEMNEDYNNDIEMLKTQEEQIKLMLNLIDLNDN